MTKYFINPFAVAGDVIAIPDSTQVSGSVSYETGFGLPYQGNLASDPAARPYPRKQFNQLMLDITTNIQQYQQHGVPNFISTSDNGGSPYSYSKYALVLYDDGVNGVRIYQSRVASNTTLPTNTTNWKWIDPDAESVPAGTMIDFAGSTVPAGYLACDGSTVNRTTYANLFAAIGILWGAGDGTTTFGLPSSARRVPVGSGGSSSGVLGNTVGSTGGTETHTLSTGEMPSHVHNAASQSFVVGDSGGTVYGGGGLGSTEAATQATGGGGAHTIMQPSMVVLRCIKF